MNKINLLTTRLVRVCCGMTQSCVTTYLISMSSSLLLICVGRTSERNTDNATFKITNKFLVWFLHRLNYGFNITNMLSVYEHVIIVSVICLFGGNVSLGPEALTPIRIYCIGLRDEKDKGRLTTARYVFLTLN